MSRDAFFYWWPVAARVVGVVGGLGQIVTAIATAEPADVGGLGFCGALVAAPAIFPTEPVKKEGDRSADLKS